MTSLFYFVKVIMILLLDFTQTWLVLVTLKCIEWDYYLKCVYFTGERFHILTSSSSRGSIHLLLNLNREFNLKHWQFFPELTQTFWEIIKVYFEFSNLFRLVNSILGKFDPSPPSLHLIRVNYIQAYTLVYVLTWKK